jgi:hypothetical protein
MRPTNGSPRPLIVAPDGQITGRLSTSDTTERYAAESDARVFQPAVWQPSAGPVGLQHPRSRVVDSATPALREALGNVLAVVQAGALLIVSLTAAVTVLLLLTRVWGWLV